MASSLTTRLELQHIDCGDEWTAVAVATSIAPDSVDGQVIEMECWIVRDRTTMREFVTYPARIVMFYDDGVAFLMRDVFITEARDLMPVADIRRAMITAEIKRVK